jgi:predicted protein tyrosine phosphatase
VDRIAVREEKVLYVCPWQEIEVHVENLGITHLVSLLGVEGSPDTPPSIGPGRHLFLDMDDIAAPIAGYDPPEEDHVQDLIDFVREWDRGGPMLVHCYAGISRSMAAALTVMCMYNPGRELEAARIMRRRAPYAKPNQRIVRFADRLLGLDGRMVDAVAALGPRPDETYVGRLVELPLDLR